MEIDKIISLVLLFDFLSFLKEYINIGKVIKKMAPSEST